MCIRDRYDTGSSSMQALAIGNYGSPGNTPTYLFGVSPYDFSAKSGCVIGTNTQIGPMTSLTSYASFAHTNQFGTANAYALAQGSAGDTTLNCASGQSIAVRNYGSLVSIINQGAMYHYVPFSIYSVTSNTGTTFNLYSTTSAYGGGTVTGQAQMVLSLIHI